jgi:hypothetical protein
MPSTMGREPQDPSYINLEEELEVHWWAVRFKVTPEQIHAAVKQFGPSPQEIEMQLSKAGKESFKNLGED